MRIPFAIILIIILIIIQNFALLTTNAEGYKYEVIDVGGFAESFIGEFVILSVAVSQDAVYVLITNNNTILYIKNVTNMDEEEVPISVKPATAGDLVPMRNGSLLVALSYDNGTVALYRIENSKVKNVYYSYINPLFNAIFNIKVLNNTDIVGYGTTVAEKGGLDYYIVYISDGQVSWNFTKNKSDKDILNMGSFGDNLFCVASDQGYLVCLTYSGKVVYENIINGKILTLKLDNNNNLYLAYNTGGTIYGEALSLSSQEILWKSEVNPVIPSSITILNDEKVAFTGLAAIGGKYYPAIAYLTNEGLVLIKSKINMPCNNLFITYSIKFNKNVGVLWNCDSKLIFRVLTIEKIMTTETTMTATNNATGSTTTSSTASGSILSIFNLVAIVSMLLIVVGGVVLILRKYKK